MNTPAHFDYLVPELPYSFCPGCSHGQVVDAIGDALAATAPDPARAVVVSDIGCVGLVDKHFAVHTFHGLHGRAITYGTGLKLARPELHVIVVVGDGGCGIGGTHLVQAARRDVDITVVVFNNFNYGMTGGEHSCTTPTDAFTSSTPTGNPEQPLDLCALTMAAGGGFIARAPAFDGQLGNTLAHAMTYPGFAMVDVWEICTAYFMPWNDFKRKSLLALSESSAMEFGVLRERAPRESQQPVTGRAMPRVELAPDYRASVSAPLPTLIAGSAGQKIKTAATMLGRAAIRSGLHATQKDDYPITVKAGHSISELMIAPATVRFTGIDAPVLAAVLTNEGLQRSRAKLAAMPRGAVIYIDQHLELDDVVATVRRVDFKTVGRRVGRENVALWAVARMLADHGGIPMAALEDTVARFTPDKYRDKAAKAVTEGATIESATVVPPPYG